MSCLAHPRRAAGALTILSKACAWALPVLTGAAASAAAGAAVVVQPGTYIGRTDQGYPIALDVTASGDRRVVSGVEFDALILCPSGGGGYI